MADVYTNIHVYTLITISIFLNISYYVITIVESLPRYMGGKLDLFKNQELPQILGERNWYDLNIIVSIYVGLNRYVYTIVLEK